MVITTMLMMQAAELLGYGAFRAKLKNDARRRLLINAKPQPQVIPVVDDQLKKLAGHPTKLVALAGDRLVKLARRIVNTKAFEHIVIGALNHKSGLRKQFKAAPTAIRIGG